MTKKTAPARTDYVVLQAIALTDEAREALGFPFALNGVVWVPVLNQQPEHGPDGAIRVITAGGKAQAIRHVTGDGADVMEGMWKAVPLSSWRGGETTKRVTASSRLPLDDGLA